MLKSITTEQLRVGMYIHAIPGAWIKSPFWKKSFKLKNQEEILALHASHIREIVIDTAKGIDTSGRGEARNANTLPSWHPLLQPCVHLEPLDLEARTATTRERERAREIIGFAKEAIQQIFGDARLGKAIDISTADDLMTEIGASLARHPDALLSMIRLKEVNDYTYLHCVAVCTLMMSLANQLGLSREKTRQAGMAGLMHDVGKALIPVDILNKPDSLTREEFSVMRTHATAGHELLKAIPGIGRTTLDVALHHHEKIDGSGYPNRLRGEKISLMSRMAAICDVYDALTSDRAYKASWDPARSIRHIAASVGHFDQTLVQAFVKAVGIYPTGACVVLQSGRIAIVVDQRPGRLLSPLVKVFYSTGDKAPIRHEIVDLAQVNDKIMHYADLSKWGISIVPSLNL